MTPRRLWIWISASLRVETRRARPDGIRCSTEQPFAPMARPRVTTQTQELQSVPTGQKVTIPWRKDGVVEEVLKLLKKHTVVLLPVLHFRCLRAVAALGITCPRQVRFGGLGALLHVHKPRGWDPDWDPEFCFKRKQKCLGICLKLLWYRVFTFTSCKGLFS